MGEDEYDIHPLDRDYSSPVEPKKAKPAASTTYHANLRRVGVFAFAAGFIVVFLSAVFLSNVRQGTVLETFGSVVNRLGMFVILIGGLTIILAYRWYWLQDLMGGTQTLPRSRRRRGPMSYSALVVWNIGAFVGVTLAVSVLREISSMEIYYFVIRFTLTFLFAMCVTVIVWHQGFLRAFAIGLLVGLVLNSFSSLVTMAGGYTQFDGRTMMLVNLGIAQLTGLVCAGYVRLLDASRGDGVYTD